MITDRTRAAYDRIAPQYATVHAAMPAELIAAADRFHRLMGPRARVLDLGCGAGRDMAWLEGLGLTVVGLDDSSGMLAQARVQVQGPLLQMDMRWPGLTTGEFEGVWCCASLLHLRKCQAPAALAEMHRLLLPRGLLFLSVQEGQGEAWEACPYAPVDRFFARYERKELAALLAQSGLSVTDTASNQSGSRRWLQFFAQSGS